MTGDSKYSASATDLSAVQRITHEHGFCLVRNVFSDAEMTRILNGIRVVRQSADQGAYADMFSHPELRWVALDDRILNLAHAVLGRELVYYGHTSISYEDEIGELTRQPFDQLHYDSRGMPNDIEAMWSGEEKEIYRGYRFGIYFNDYEHYSGGLKVIPGSHVGDVSRLTYDSANMLELTLSPANVINVPRPCFELYNIPSHRGDVVIWSLRTVHSAGAKILLSQPDLGLDPSVEKMVSQAVPDSFAPIPGPRNALFFDYAAAWAPEIDLYIKWRNTRIRKAKDHNLFTKSRFDDPANMQLAATRGIRFRLDGIIISLALYLMAELEKLSLWGPGKAFPKVVPGHLMAHRDRLYAMCARHVEYQPSFPLFDYQKFDVLSVKGVEAALGVVFEGVTQWRLP